MSSISCRRGELTRQSGEVSTGIRLSVCARSSGAPLNETQLGGALTRISIHVFSLYTHPISLCFYFNPFLFYAQC